MDWRSLETSSLQALARPTDQRSFPFRTVWRFADFIVWPDRSLASRRILASAYEKQLAELDGVKFGRKRLVRRKRRENDYAIFHPPLSLAAKLVPATL
jgi:hypothetical protein